MSNEETKPEFTYTDAAYWEKRWEIGAIDFHKTRIHPMLEKHLLKLTENRNHLRFLLPLCGKALDIKWLASLGHYVVGVECSQLAVEQFFSENDIKFSVEDSNDFKIFIAEEQRIKIYLGDFFNFTSNYESPFDCVWDRGALVALPFDLRTKYSRHILKLLKPDFRYLLDAFKYNAEYFPGPPHCVPFEEIKNLYGQNNKLEQIDSCVSRPFCEKHLEDLPSEIVYLITPFV